MAGGRRLNRAADSDSSWRFRRQLGRQCLLDVTRPSGTSRSMRWREHEVRRCVGRTGGVSGDTRMGCGWFVRVWCLRTERMDQTRAAASVAAGSVTFLADGLDARRLGCCCGGTGGQVARGGLLPTTRVGSGRGAKGGNAARVRPPQGDAEIAVETPVKTRPASWALLVALFVPLTAGRAPLATLQSVPAGRRCGG